MKLRMRSELEPPAYPRAFPPEPEPWPQDKAGWLERAEQEGEIVADCPGCRAFYEAEDPREVCTPRHRASRRCQSGRRAHCSCAACF